MIWILIIYLAIGLAIGSFFIALAIEGKEPIKEYIPLFIFSLIWWPFLLAALARDVL